MGESNMFKMRLLRSTALIIVASLSCGAQPEALAQTQMRNNIATRDVNGEFLCTYGSFTVSSYSGFSSHHVFYFGWQRVAVPIVGRGQTVRRITVKEEQYPPNSQFSAGIFSNTPSGLPGKRITSGAGLAPPTCGRVTLPLAPTTLAKHKQYWIEENVPSLASDISSNSARWAINPHTKLRAFIKRESCSSSFCTSTPWTEQSAGPWFRLK